MKKLLYLLLFLTVVCLNRPFLFSDVASASSQPDVTVDDIQVEKMQYADQENSWLVVSCQVNNLSEEAGDVSIVIKSIDKWAYERKSFYLSGFFEPGETRRLSVMQVMDGKMFEGIRKYEVKSVKLL